ncbi:MAG: malonyl-CoA decarboxylase [Verrucomicrobia bacterium]|nr:malonyl-CoA decarboxylase [Verrucomicrobiota bacterium]MDA1068705.1 malonyl-CoA decarboxylase [Verrucomicrobiota bacterium]
MIKPKKDSRPNQTGTINSALHNLSLVWHEITRLSGRNMTPKDARPDVLRRQMEACLVGQGGEVSARGRAVDLAQSFLNFSDDERLVFFKILARDFGVDQVKVNQATEALKQAVDKDALENCQMALRQALQPARVALLRKFNALPSGPRFLVELRSELLKLTVKHPELRFLERDLKDILNSWFDVGFLELRRINWDASASLLEKLGRYEAVHRVRGWHDLKNRLDTDRRCFAFFHPSMPDEPLIFIEVALVNGLADQIQGLLDEKAPVLDPGKANTAIFYSISNTQQGLAGISFGNFLIKQVVDQLRQELPKLKQFATLSPIPGFKRWLDQSIQEGNLDLTSSEKKKLEAVTRQKVSAKELRELLGSVKWAKNEKLAEALKPILLRFVAFYLLKAKGRNQQRALDPVAHFHLTNGARMKQLNWMADTSGKGLRESAGLMINYLYSFDRIERRHEAYSGQGKIAVSSTISGLIK